MLGQWNFDEISVDYFRERTAGFETFKTGQIDLWIENVAKDWVTAYDFPAVQNGLIKKERIEVEPRRADAGVRLQSAPPQFQDVRVRQAFNLAFDFEHINKLLMYDLYIRTESYFDNSELKASGLPQGRELEIPERGAGRDSARGVHHRIQEPDQPDARGAPRQPAEGGASCSSRPAGSAIPRPRTTCCAMRPVRR